MPRCRDAILEAWPKLTVEVLGGLDHSMFDIDARGRVHDVVQNWLGVGRLASPGMKWNYRTGRVNSRA